MPDARVLTRTRKAGAPARRHARRLRPGTIEAAEACPLDDARPKPMLLFNPGDDEDFVAYAQAGLTNGVTTPAGLQQRLRRRYERAVVRSRGLSGEPHDVWYVYRDGRWVPPGGGGDDDDRPRGCGGRSAGDG